MRWENNEPLILYLLGNIPVKNYQNRSMCVEVIARQRSYIRCWDSALRHDGIYCIATGHKVVRISVLTVIYFGSALKLTQHLSVGGNAATKWRFGQVHRNVVGHVDDVTSSLVGTEMDDRSRAGLYYRRGMYQPLTLSQPLTDSGMRNEYRPRDSPLRPGR